jgi:NADH-quinone oxidoreductase subunit N
MFLLSIFSLFVGCLGASVQVRIRRYLAYSSIGNTGLLFFLLSFFSLDFVPVFWHYFSVYLISYFFLFQFFFLIKFLRFPEKELQTWSDLALLVRANPVLVSLITLLLFSLAGLPPLPGFWAKVNVLFVLVSTANYFFAFIFLFLQIFSVFYYLRVVLLLYFESTLVSRFASINFVSAFWLCLSFFSFLLIFGVFPFLYFLGRFWWF